MLMKIKTLQSRGRTYEVCFSYIDEKFHATVEGVELKAETMARIEELIHNRLRQCPGCSRWFFAERKDKRACSTRCRQNTISRTDAFKQHRRLYMRWYLQRERGDTKLTFEQWVNSQQGLRGRGA
jgi:hypothetical protein